MYDDFPIYKTSKGVILVFKDNNSILKITIEIFTYNIYVMYHI